MKYIRECEKSISDRGAAHLQSGTEVARNVMCVHLEKRAMLGTSFSIMRGWHRIVS